MSNSFFEKLRPGKWIFFEFLIPPFDYFWILKRREWVYEWIIPGLLSFLVWKYFPIIPGGSAQPIDKLKDFAGLIINLVAILAGFTLAILTILVTASGDSITKLKSAKSATRSLNNSLISLYQETLNNFTFVVFVEFILLLYNVSIIVLIMAERAKSWANLFFALDLFLIFHIVALNLRNITNIYFIYWPEGVIQTCSKENDSE